MKRDDTAHQGELALKGDHEGERAGKRADVRTGLMGTLDRLNDRYGRGTLMVS